MKDEYMVSAFAHEAEHDLNKGDIAEIKGRHEGKGGRTITSMIPRRVPPTSCRDRYWPRYHSPARC